ncbi:glycoside hydrolase family 172 protein [Nocardia sp. NPDC051832]|uniref:glycoside hydrolase family 172 protein n=1 Tax=Nocardia sp. NPDC051832 TaxID=3155673 RepID=UPI00341AF601
MTPAGSTPDLWRLDAARTRSVSPENPTGVRGGGAQATEGTGAHASRLLGPGWKVSPSISLAPGETAVLADVSGPGVFRHFWLTTDRSVLRQLTLRMHWDDHPHPAVDLPLGHFFCNGWEELALLGSEMLVVAPAGGLNSYWPMPFRARARITLHNGSDRTVPVYYQLTYTEEDLPADAAYLHTEWRRSAPLGTPAVHTILDTTPGPGRYVGTYLAIQPGADGWWGEGELKFYLDGDTTHPTLCGTGTEDYFGGAWNFDLAGVYRTYSTPYLGLHQVLPPNEIYQAHQRFGMYRWHVRDPLCFQEDLRVTIQALGWSDPETYLPLEHADIATTAWWYRG